MTVSKRVGGSGWKANVLLVGASLFASALLLEVGLRVFVPVRKPPAPASTGAAPVQQEFWAAYDADIGYRLNPKWGDINPSGLRDHPVTPKNGRFRILFLGDSIGFYGDTVDDTFVGHFRRQLRGNPAYSQVDVLNASVKGYTNYQELQFLKKNGPGLEPDLVGIGFCLNDLHRFLHKFEVRDGRIVPDSYQFAPEARDNSRGLARRLAHRSRLLVWLRDNMPVARQAAAWQTSQGFSFDYNSDTGSAWKDASWRMIESQMDEMRTLGRQRQFGVFVVAFPLAVQYDKKYLERDRQYVLKPQRKLREICERLSIPFYDLYLEMHPGLFDEDGIHLSPEARRLVGERISRFVTEARLIQASQSRNDSVRDVIAAEGQRPRGSHPPPGQVRPLE